VAVTDKIVIVSGKGVDAQESVYVLHTASEGEPVWTKHQTASELVRKGHTAQVVDTHIVVVGGFSTANNDSDVYLLNLGKLILTFDNYIFRSTCHTIESVEGKAARSAETTAITDLKA
jgi:hypothetical protein